MYLLKDNDATCFSRKGDGAYEENKFAEPHMIENRTSYIVTNCDLVRVRYLLVYAKQPSSLRYPTTSSNRDG